MNAISPAVCPLAMHAPAPLTLWRQLPATRRRHLLMAAAGTVISWLLAALMACTTTASPVALYKQLGGEAGIDDIVGHTLDRVAANPRSAHSFDGVRMSILKRNVSTGAKNELLRRLAPSKRDIVQR